MSDEIELRKSKDSKNKVKKTFNLSIEAVKAYVALKNDNYDVTDFCTQVLESRLLIKAKEKGLIGS